MDAKRKFASEIFTLLLSSQSLEIKRNENDEDAYRRWTMPNASFLDVSGDNYRELREGVHEHFLRGS
jgi:hypothetical protein